MGDVMILWRALVFIYGFSTAVTIVIPFLYRDYPPTLKERFTYWAICMGVVTFALGLSAVATAWINGKF